MAERTESTLNYNRFLKRTATLAFGVVVLAGCGGEENKADSTPKNPNSASDAPQSPESTPLPEVSTRPLSLGEQVIGATVMCESLDEADPLYKKLQKAKLVVIEGKPQKVKQVVVDGRCDSAAAAPVGIYPEPTQESESLDGEEVYTEDVLKAVCIEGGQYRQNVQANGTNEWIKVKVDSKTGYIPAIWVQRPALEECPRE